MSPALNGSSAVWRFEGNDAIEIRDGINNFRFLHGTATHVYITNSQFADFWAPRFMPLETDNAINVYNCWPIVYQLLNKADVLRTEMQL